MKIHLIRSEELDKEIFTKVIQLLQSVPGVIQFYSPSRAAFDVRDLDFYENEIEDRDQFNRKIVAEREFVLEADAYPFLRQTATWKTLFSICDEYRRKCEIGNDEFVFLLTDIANENNWFASLDVRMPFNGFIHTADWEYFIQCAPQFPIAYEVMALMLQQCIFKGDAKARQIVHAEPIGCVNDFCENKKQIMLKMRTGDICHACMEVIKENLPMNVIYHALQIMESLRVKMLFAQNFKQQTPLSKLIITTQGKIFLPDFGNVEIRLRPLEKALYFLFLRHPEGILRSSLADHRAELFEIYAGITQAGLREDIQERINNLVNVLSNTASEKLSRIKSVFEESIGTELAKHYYIQGANGIEKKISLDRELVEWG